MEAVGRRTKRGLSLIEAAIVLAVGGGVIGAIWVAASAVTEKSRQKTTLEMLTLCVNKMRMVLKQVPAYSYPDSYNFDNLAVSVGALPKSLQTPYGRIIIGYERNNGGSDFTLRLYDLNQSACIAVVSFFSNRATTYGLTRVVFFDAYINYTNFPITTSLITNNCSDSDSIVLQFNY